MNRYAAAQRDGCEPCRGFTLARTAARLAGAGKDFTDAGLVVVDGYVQRAVDVGRAAGERDAAARMAHSLKGTGGTIGARDLSLVAQHLEEAIKAAHPDQPERLAALENELVKSTDAYKNGHVVYLAHPNVWYTAEGGIQALSEMLSDLENALL